MKVAKTTELSSYCKSFSEMELWRRFGSQNVRTIEIKNFVQYVRAPSVRIARETTKKLNRTISIEEKTCVMDKTW